MAQYSVKKSRGRKIKKYRKSRRGKGRGKRSLKGGKTRRYKVFKNTRRHTLGKRKGRGRGGAGRPPGLTLTFNCSYPYTYNPHYIPTEINNLRRAAETDKSGEVNVLRMHINHIFAYTPSTYKQTPDYTERYNNGNVDAYPGVGVGYADHTLNTLTLDEPAKQNHEIAIRNLQRSIHPYNISSFNLFIGTAHNTGPMFPPVVYQQLTGKLEEYIPEPE